eukprot:1009946-Rhodomonas_salina.2
MESLSSKVQLMDADRRAVGSEGGVGSVGSHVELSILITRVLAAHRMRIQFVPGYIGKSTGTRVPGYPGSINPVLY